MTSLVTARDSPNMGVGVGVSGGVRGKVAIVLPTAPFGDPKL